jgi:hypothetical protein
MPSSLILSSLLLHSAAPTCFVTCVPSSGNSSVPVELHADRGQSAAYLGFFSGGGIQQIHLRTEGRENGDLGAVAP